MLTIKVQNCIIVLFIVREAYMKLFKKLFLVTCLCSAVVGLSLFTFSCAKSYGITYDTVYEVENPNPTTYKKGKTFALKSLEDTEWYSFTGWYKDFERTTKITDIDAKKKGNLTVYAGWEPIDYVVTYKIDGEILSSQKFNFSDQTLSLPEIPQTKKGYVGKWESFSVSPSDFTVNAVWTPIEYFINYEQVIGATNENPTSFTVEDGDITLLDAKLDNYDFLGWYSDGRKIGVIQTSIATSLTLEAKWQLTEYSIEYKNLKGASSSGFVISYTVESENITLPSLSVEHYTFNGWIDQNGKKITSIRKGSFGNLVLTADFTPIEYKIEYLNVKNADLSKFRTSYNVESESFLLPTPTTDYYDFLRWTDKNGNEVKTIYRGSFGDLTITAKWLPINYKITYNSNVEIDDEEFVKEYNYDSERIELPSLEVDYYTFDGWYGEDGSKVTDIKSGSYGDIVLTAKFTPIKYSITYLVEGNETDINPIEYTVEDEFDLISPTKYGYTFDGWFDENENEITKITKGTNGNLVLTAKFSVTTFNINYNNLQGADISSFTKTYTIYSEDIYLSNITQKGFEFVGWVDEDGKTVTCIEKGGYGDIELYAVWDANEYVVTLSSLYGELEETEFTVSYKENYTLPTLTCEGKKFLGWYTNTGESGERYTDENGNSLEGYPIYVGRTLFARWVNVDLVITYHTDGGTEIESSTVLYGSAFDDGIIPTKENSMFAGWYSSDFSIKYTNSSIIKENTDVYAKWVTSIPISSAEEFLAIYNDTSLNYYFTQDISLNGAVLSPISSFTGTLDGMGYKLKDFMINATSVSGSYGFICTNNGTLQNLTFSDFTYNVSANAGVKMGVVSGVNNGNIYNVNVENCIVKMAFSVNVYPGFYGEYTIYAENGHFGVVSAVNNGKVIGCVNRADVSISITNRYSGEFVGNGQNVYADFYSGGIVGLNYGTVTKSSYQEGEMTVFTYSFGYIYNNSNSIGNRIVHSYSKIGGIIGKNQGYCTENFSTSTVYGYAKNENVKTSRTYLNIGCLVGENGGSGKVERCFSSGKVNGGFSDDTRVGGLIGYNEASVSNCYSSCSVALNVSGGRAGGFVATNAKSIQNSYSLGNVVSSVKGVIGGFSGDNTSAGSIQKCFTLCSVNTASGSTSGHFVGSNSGVVFKCYFDLDTPLIVGGGYVNSTVENESILGVTYKELWNDAFLKETLYWDSENWVFLSTECPILEWETSIDHLYEATVIEPTCSEFGYTVYHCADCSRFFIKDIVLSPGHEFMEIEKIDATCEETGKVLSYCVRCDEWITTQTIEANGHSKDGFIERLEPTCTEEGYEINYCADCDKNVKTVITANGHTPKRVPPVVQDCDRVGYTEKMICADCETVLEEAREIPPHFYNVTVKTNPSCTETGLCDRICTKCYVEEIDVVIPATGHFDENGDYICDECGKLFGKYNEKVVVEIDSVEGMLAINNNLYGIYRLTANITLPDNWTPIGDEELPFGGYFDGNGYTITLGKFTDMNVVGIFGYNKGIISNLTVSGLSVIVQSSVNGTNNSSLVAMVGSITAYNAGYVIGCKSTGNKQFYVSATVESNKYAPSNLLLQATYGDLVGINLANGTVSDCSSDAKIEISVSNSVTCQVKWQLSALMGSLGPSKHKNTKLESVVNVVFGGIVGENRGLVEGCTVEGQYNVNAHRGVVSVENLYGYSTAITNYYHGTIVGSGNGKTENCINASNQNFNGGEKNSLYEKEYLFWALKYDYNIIMNK